jgi:hypothetical protein
MRLVDLIAFFRQGRTFEDFCIVNGVNTESEVIEIYAQDPINLDSKLGFFPIEETDGQIKYQSGTLIYHNLFDFFYFLEVIKSVKSNEGISNEELAQKLFSYAINDA